MPKKRQKRGYLRALLISFDPWHTFFWKIYSERPKLAKSIKFDRKWKNIEEKQRYHACERIINLLRPIIRDEGIKSVILCHPPDSNIGKVFKDHITKHHQWILSRRQKPPVQFGEITGNAADFEEVIELLESEYYQKEQEETTSNEGDNLLALLDHAINVDDAIILFGIKEIEELVIKSGKRVKDLSKKADYLLVNSEFLEKHPQKNRIHRLLQIAKNKKIKTRILEDESPSGDRVAEMGGILCFQIVEKQAQKSNLKKK